MISKKNPKLNPEKNRIVYFQLGLFITSAGLLMAFSWKSPVSNKENVKINRDADVPSIEMVVEKQVETPEVKQLTPEKTVQPKSNQLTEEYKEKKSTDKKVDVGVNPDPIKSMVYSGFEPPVGPAPDGADIAVKYPDKDASFPGNWKEYLSNKVIYPERAQQFGEAGVIWVEFIVELDGSLSNVHVNERSHKSSDLRKEALRVVKASPNWKPGILNGEKVRTHARAKINFILVR